MPNQDKLTPAQKDAIVEVLIYVKNFLICQPQDNIEFAKNIIKKIDAAQKAFDE